MCWHINNCKCYDCYDSTNAYIERLFLFTSVYTGSVNLLHLVDRSDSKLNDNFSLTVLLNKRRKTVSHSLVNISSFGEVYGD